MAKPIDKALYKRVEWHLHNEKLLRDVIRQYENDILLSSQGTDYSQPRISHTGTISDVVSQKAFRLDLAPYEVASARRWIVAIEDTRRYFTGTNEAKLFRLFYGTTAGIDLVAAAMNTSRRGIERLRDNVVYRCAMTAAATKLIKIQQETEDKP